MTDLNRFQNRFIVVTETFHVTKRNTFSYKSFSDKRDAMHAERKINSANSFFKRAYIVDRDNSPNVILP